MKQEIIVSKVEHATGRILYATPNESCVWRVQTLFTKEPDTIEWLAELDPGDVFVDVGANVGMYSIWAAKTAGARVFAFEPESQNFALLCQNALINRTDVMAFPFALSDENSFGPLFLSNFAAGGSCHTYGDAVTYKGTEMRPSFVQGSCAVRLDMLVEKEVIPQPDVVKIDVDGLEHRVIAGAMGCLAKVRSVLIEIDTGRGDHQSLVGRMEDMGFRWNAAQADKARRTEGAFKGIGNVIFRR